MTAIEKYRRETARYLARACRFRRTMDAPTWSEKVRRMENGARYRFDYAPYQREMMETPFREDVQLTVFMLPSRFGKTEVGMNIIGHGICEQPRKILVMYPTISAAEKWSKETLMTGLVNPTPEIAELIGDGEGRRKSNNTILHKLFPGGLLNAFGSNVGTEMRRAKGNLLFADEIDAFETTEAGEGDPLEIFWVRGSEYPDTIKIAASYPSLKGRSKIEDLMLKSDFRVMQYPCPHCGEAFVMDRNQLRYDRDKPEDAWMECPVNECKITDAERKKLVLSYDKWTPTRPFTGIAGFHGSGMMSPHPTQKGFKSHLHYVAVKELEIETAANREEAKRVFINTFDAKTYEPPEEAKPDPLGLSQEAYDYLKKIDDHQYSIPQGVLVVTGGGDVQADRIEFEFVGHGLRGETFGLGYHILSGNVLEPKVWERLDDLLQTTFLHPCGKVLRPQCVFIDSKYKPRTVRKFTAPRVGKGIYAVYGSTTLGLPLLEKPKKTTQGLVYELGTHEAKSAIYQNAHLRRDPRSDFVPHGYMHFPKGNGYEASYFKGLLIENVSLKKAKDGNFYEFFEKPEKRSRNEPLDVRVYNLAAIQKVNPEWGPIAEKLRLKSDQKPENP